ncbi:hypothetical protein ACQP00_20205 [Dactylosporangium sp. CS-047395]|uniref:hypothetical protein n=1 Tax=Dactylosporangium sp. CS-047395 TaxID=3239936 RepID=UPI003D89EEA0
MEQDAEADTAALLHELDRQAYAWRAVLDRLAELGVPATDLVGQYARLDQAQAMLNHLRRPVGITASPASKASGSPQRQVPLLG